METNPPLSKWESLIKSMKRSFESITNRRTITTDLLTTLLCEVERILNSQPSTRIGGDITDFKIVTSHHILPGLSQPNVEPSKYENVEMIYHKKMESSASSHFQQGQNDLIRSKIVLQKIY